MNGFVLIYASVVFSIEYKNGKFLLPANTNLLYMKTSYKSELAESMKEWNVVKMYFFVSIVIDNKLSLNIWIS